MVAVVVHNTNVSACPGKVLGVFCPGKVLGAVCPGIDPICFLIGQAKWFTVGEDPLLNTFCIRGYRDTVNTNCNDSIWQR